MSPDQIRAATSEALTVVKQKMAAEHRVYPAPLAITPGNPEAIAEVERGDVRAVGLRLKRILNGLAVVRLPGELP